MFFIKKEMFLQPTRTSHSRTGSPWRATSAAGVCRAAQCSVGGGRRPNNPTVLRSRSTPMSQRAVVVGYGTQIEGQNVLQVKEGPSFVRCAGGGPGPSAMSSEQYPPSRPRSLHRAGRPTRRAYPRSDARTDARGPLLRPDQGTQVCRSNRAGLWPRIHMLSLCLTPPFLLCLSAANTSPAAGANASASAARRLDRPCSVHTPLVSLAGSTCVAHAARRGRTGGQWQQRGGQTGSQGLTDADPSIRRPGA